MLSYCAKEIEFIYKVKLVLWPFDSYALIFLVLIIKKCMEAQLCYICTCYVSVLNVLLSQKLAFLQLEVEVILKSGLLLEDDSHFLESLAFPLDNICEKPLWWVQCRVFTHLETSQRSWNSVFCLVLLFVDCLVLVFSYKYT